MLYPSQLVLMSNHVITICYGLLRDLLTPGPGKGGYLAFIGRISPEKAADMAIRIAGEAGMKIRIAAKIGNFDHTCIHEKIEPLFALPHAEYIGEMDEVQKADFLGNAVGLLFPVTWLEPFGLAMIEAMACGTPVIAFRCGSVPELLEEGIFQASLLRATNRQLQPCIGCLRSVVPMFAKHSRSTLPLPEWLRIMPGCTRAK